MMMTISFGIVRSHNDALLASSNTTIRILDVSESVNMVKPAATASVTVLTFVSDWPTLMKILFQLNRDESLRGKDTTEASPNA